MKALGSPAAVLAAVRDDADAEVERIERDSRAEVARVAADEVADPLALPEREARLHAARREARERLAQEDFLDAREALTAREAWLRRAVAEGERLLDEPAPADERRATLARLAREGLVRMTGEAVEIVVGPEDAALLDARWAQGLAPGRRVCVVERAEEATGGCLVRTDGGKVSFDNTRPARARRFEAAWRAALGALYKTAGGAG